MLPLIGALIGPVSGLISKVLDKTCKDKDLAQKLKAEAMTQLLSQDNQEFMTHLKEASSIIRAEANSQSWLARNWRPMLMCLFGLILLNNYVIFPYIHEFSPEHSVLLPVPEQLWGLLKIGVGGYVVGRSAEKVAEVYKDKG